MIKSDSGQDRLHAGHVEIAKKVKPKDIVYGLKQKIDYYLPVGIKQVSSVSFAF